MMAAAMLSSLDANNWHLEAPAEPRTSSSHNFGEHSATAKQDHPLNKEEEQKEQEDHSRPRATALLAMPNAGCLDHHDEVELSVPTSPHDKGDTSIFAALRMPLETLTSPEMVVIHYAHSLALSSEKHAAMPVELAQRGLMAEVLYETMCKIHKIRSSSNRRRSLSCAGLGFLLTQTQISQHDKRVSDHINAVLERTNRQLAASRVGVRFAWVYNNGQSALRAFWDSE